MIRISPRLSRSGLWGTGAPYLFIFEIQGEDKNPFRSIYCLNEDKIKKQGIDPEKGAVFFI